jgi:hypothetical protein
MAIKTFTTGEVLTASDTNTYLANSGLTYITTGTATTGSTLSLSNCFTSTHDAYRIVINTFITSSAAGLDVQMLASGSPTATGYYWVYLSAGYTTTATYSQIGAANSSSWSPLAISAGGSDSGASAFDLFNPKVTNKTIITGMRTDPRTTGAVGQLNGYLNDNTSYDGIRFTTAGITNLTVVVYGYRKA